MPKFSLDEGDEAGHIFAPPNPVRGDHLLIVERELLDPATRQKVGTITAALTFMEISPSGDALVLGIAEHHLDDSVKHPAQAGGISVQGSFRLSDEHPVFTMVGGTGGYRNWHGTVTYDSRAEKFNYDVN